MTIIRGEIDNFSPSVRRKSQDLEIGSFEWEICGLWISGYEIRVSQKMSIK